jgi:hypothetical protein
MLKERSPRACISSIQNTRYISMPRAASIPPRSMIESGGHPKLSSSPSTSCLAVVAAHEDAVAAGELLRVDHHLVSDGVQRLHDPCLGDGPLDLLAQAVGVADGQREPAGLERQGIGDVDQDLSREVLGPGGGERIERDRSVGAVHHRLTERGRVGERAVRRVRAGLGRPDGGRLVVGRPRAHPHLVADLDQPARQHPADRPRPEYSVPHPHPPFEIGSNL